MFSRRNGSRPQGFVQSIRAWLKAVFSSRFRRQVLPALLGLLPPDPHALAAALPVNVVAPANLVSEDQAFGSGTLSGAVRIQMAYGARHFTDAGMLITELRFRPDYQYGRAFVTTLAHIQIRLSTTSRDPEALSRTFADNVGEDETLVFDGPLPISSAFTGSPMGPKEFDIVVPLTQPFVYGPGLGSLLVEIRNFASSDASLLSGQSRSDDAASRVIGAVNAASGNGDRGVDALQIAYVPTNGPALPPPHVIRGPYLQSATTSNIVVRWRTSRAAESRVQFGLAPDLLPWAVADESPKVDHIITLTNLAADTQYFYAVGTRETNLAAGPDHHFFTAPKQTRPVRIWALSDFGTTGNPYGFEENSAGVRDAYLAYAGTRPTDVWLTMGDNSQTTGLDADYQSQVFDIYPAILRRNVLWPTMGNHDAAYFPTSFDYTNVFSPPTRGEAGGVASNSKFYYSFDYANIHFISLDSLTVAARSNPAMLDWLERDLAANIKDWTIAYWHCPPYTFGTHNSDNPADTWSAMVDMREIVLPILESHGVDLVLSGHSHVYERSYLLDGHYGDSTSFAANMIKDSGSGQPEDTGAYRKSGVGPIPHQGTVYVVAAVGGWNTPLIWGLPDHHPAMRGRLQQRGSMVIDVNTNRLDAVLLNDTGAIADRFTILKGVAPEALRVATYRMSGDEVRLQWKSIPGQVYRVEQSPAPTVSDWIPASGDITAIGATTGWTNIAPAGTGAGFYRVKQMSQAQEIAPHRSR
jgi:hypothetical protein